MLALVMFLGVFIGAIMGLTGAGGGILAVPVLVSGLNWTMQQAAPVALISVACGAAVGALDGFRMGLVRYKAALLMAVCGVPLTRLGQYWAYLLPQSILLILFGMLMVVVATRFLRFNKGASDNIGDNFLRLVQISNETGKFIWTLNAALILSAIGAMTGLLTGLLGVGGGFLIVPLMRRFTYLSMQGVVATSLFLITLVSGGGVVNAISNGAQLPPVETVGFVSAMTVGMLIGRRVTQYLKPVQIQIGFGLLLAFVSLYMLAKGCLLYFQIEL